MIMTDIDIDIEEGARLPRTPLQVQANRLFNERQYKSCEMVALFELSQMTMPTTNRGEAVGAAAITLEILGDCAGCTERHRQASDYYRDA